VSKDIKPATVDKAAEQIKKSQPSLSSEQARKIARDTAERLNRQRRQ
jgi:cytochrome c551/c552